MWAYIYDNIQLSGVSPVVESRTYFQKKMSNFTITYNSHFILPIAYLINHFDIISRLVK